LTATTIIGEGKETTNPQLVGDLAPEENNNNFDRKLELVTADLQPFYPRVLRSLYAKSHTATQNFGERTNCALTIINYLLAMKTEKNLSLHSREIIIKTLSKLSTFSNFKDWKVYSRNDVLTFLDTLRKTDASDPLHKWIGTYNLYRNILQPFFKWVYSPNIEGRRRPKPACIENIPKLRRQETSIYRPADLWTQQDDMLFLRYCPSKRDRCYHAISRDLSARPAEILDLRRRDVNFKLVGNSQYAEVTVNGKTGTRPIPLISSIPYLKDWWDEHPQRGNPSAFLIPSLDRKNYGRRMSVNGLYHTYRNYRQEFFPKLLQDPGVPKEDRDSIKSLLQKPWNPYVRRHSALTEKSTILKEHILRQHAGWSGRSQMHLKYLHYFGSESSESLLEAYGLVNPDERADIYTLKPRVCPNCNEANKPDSKWCAKCRMVLSYDAYEEMKEQQVNKNELDELRAELEWLKGRAVMK
jgi:integrase/recombinase XerD